MTAPNLHDLRMLDSLKVNLLSIKDEKLEDVGITAAGKVVVRKDGKYLNMKFQGEDGARFFKKANERMIKGLNELTTNRNVLTDQNTIKNVLKGIENKEVCESLPSSVENSRKKDDAKVIKGEQCLLLEKNGDSLKHAAHSDINDRLLYAIKCFNFDEVKRLVKKGADIKSGNKGYDSPLWIAALCGNIDIVKLLVMEGFNVNDGRNASEKALWVATKCGHLEIVKYLVENGAAINFGAKGEESLLVQAVEAGNLDLFKYLEDKGADINGSTNLVALFSEAAKGGHFNFVEYFEEKKEADINASTKAELAPLSAAAGAGNFELAKYLVERGADINGKGANLGTPLSKAAQAGHIELVNFLIGEKADIHSNSRGNLTPLSLAADQGHLQLVKCLVEKGADINSKATGAGTPLSIAASKGHFEVVKYLVERGADINAMTTGLETPLSQTIVNGHLEVAKYLLKNGADFSSANSLETLLSKAADKGHLEIVKYLVENGADVNACVTGFETPLSKAADGGHLEVVKYLEEKGGAGNNKIKLNKEFICSNAHTVTGFAKDLVRKYPSNTHKLLMLGSNSEFLTACLKQNLTDEQFDGYILPKSVRGFTEKNKSNFAHLFPSKSELSGRQLVIVRPLQCGVTMGKTLPLLKDGLKEQGINNYEFYFPYYNNLIVDKNLLKVFMDRTVSLNRTDFDINDYEGETPTYHHRLEFEKLTSKYSLKKNPAFDLLVKEVGNTFSK